MLVIWDYEARRLREFMLPVPVFCCCLLNEDQDLLVATASEVMVISRRRKLISAFGGAPYFAPREPPRIARAQSIQRLPPPVVADDGAEQFARRRIIEQINQLTLVPETRPIPANRPLEQVEEEEEEEVVETAKPAVAKVCGTARAIRFLHRSKAKEERRIENERNRKWEEIKARIPETSKQQPRAKSARKSHFTLATKDELERVVEPPRTTSVRTSHFASPAKDELERVVEPPRATSVRTSRFASAARDELERVVEPPRAASIRTSRFASATKNELEQVMEPPKICLEIPTAPVPPGPKRQELLRRASSLDRLPLFDGHLELQRSRSLEKLVGTAEPDDDVFRALVEVPVVEPERPTVPPRKPDCLMPRSGRPPVTFRGFPPRAQNGFAHSVSRRPLSESPLVPCAVVEREELNFTVIRPSEALELARELRSRKAQETAAPPQENQGEGKARSFRAIMNRIRELEAKLNGRAAEVDLAAWRGVPPVPPRATVSEARADDPRSLTGTLRKIPFLSTAKPKAELPMIAPKEKHVSKLMPIPQTRRDQTKLFRVCHGYP
jgi:hypothetical protein